jgi:hypothetical protein
MKLTEEYCWAIKQASERSYNGQSGSIVLDFGFHTQLTTCTFMIYSFLTFAAFSGP